MAIRISDKEKKEIIAYYIDCSNLRETARHFNRNPSTIKKIVDKDKKIVEYIRQKSTEKKDNNTKTVLEQMEERKIIKVKLLDKILDAMNGKCDNIDMFTNIKDLATAYGIIIDKELKREELGLKAKEIDNMKTDTTALDKLDNILKGIEGEANATKQ